MKNNYEKNDSNSTIITIAKAAGVLGLAYLAYQKRDKVSKGWDSVKSSTSNVVAPIADGIKQSSNKFQDFIHDKTHDATAAMSHLSDDIEKKYNKLQGEAQDTYKTQLKSLRDKIDTLVDSKNSTTGNSGTTGSSSSAMGSNSASGAKDNGNHSTPYSSNQTKSASASH
jgi:gas vesicle protein